MARKTERPGGMGRREFIAGAGAVFTGTVSTLAVWAPSLTEGSETTPCRALLHDPARCVGCGVCGMMCSLSRAGEVGPSLSRSGVDRDPFTYDFTFIVCQQCDYPRCYHACPLKGRARLIDDVTGIVSVNQERCVGCGKCVAACPYDPPRTKLHPETRVALNCDRCLDRDEGPACVEYCPMDALTCASARPLRKPRPRLFSQGRLQAHPPSQEP